MRALLLAVPVFWVVVGCARLPFRAASDVSAELLSVSAAFPSDESGEMGVTLRLRNPGQARGTVLAVSWELWLEGRRFASGIQSMTEELPPGERTLEVRLPLTFLKTRIRPGRQEVRAAVRGSVFVAFGEERQEVQFERVSRIMAQGLPLPRWLTEEN